MTKTSCPISNAKAVTLQQSPGIDGDLYDSPDAGGKYRISGTAKAMLNSLSADERQYLIDLITYENNFDGIPIISSLTIKEAKKKVAKREKSKSGKNKAQERRLEAEAQWKNFLNWVDEYSRANWLFRGVADAQNHQLVPKIARLDLGGYNANSEATIFRNFQRRARQYIDASNMTEWDWLAVAQHHGLPTRLLDWTSNALVAAYFSVTSFPEDSDAIIYALNTSKYDLLDSTASCRPFEVTADNLFKPSSHSLRVVSQKGFFTISPDPSTPLEEKDSLLKTFNIPATDKHIFAKKLFYLGMDSSHIMADIDGICQTLGWQYKNNIAIGKFNY